MEPYSNVLLHINKYIHLIVLTALGVEVRVIKMTCKAKYPISWHGDYQYYS